MCFICVVAGIDDIECKNKAFGRAEGVGKGERGIQDGWLGTMGKRIGIAQARA